jgi:hypothetical protein
MRIGAESCRIRRAVRCEAYRFGFVCVSARGLSVQVGSIVPAGSVCVSARSLVVPVQNPSVRLPRSQQLLFLPCRRRKACSATGSPRPARYVKRDLNVVSRSRHKPEYNVLNEVVIEKATYT